MELELRQRIISSVVPALVGAMHSDGKVDQAVLPIALLKQFNCLPAFIETQSLDLLTEILKITTPLGSISQTSQALGDQARLNRHESGRKLPILRGKHIRPLRIEGSTDWIDESFLTTRQEGGFTAKVKLKRFSV